MTNSLSYQSMTEALQEELLRLCNPDLRGKALNDEIARATAMAYLAQSIVQVGRFEIFEIGRPAQELLPCPGELCTR